MRPIVILLKMGGSVITDKSTPLSFRHDAVVRLAEAVSKLAEPAILVHGGGSFGHHYSVMYDMHTAPAAYDLKGFAVVRNSMVHLHHLVLDALVQGGVTPYSCPPSILMDGSPPAPTERIGDLQQVAESGMCPVVYGDAMWCGNGTSCILSGDMIMAELARALDVRLAVFATDVDGLYTTPDSGEIIRHVDAGDYTTDIPSGRTDGGSDVTGGMARKVKSAKQISAGGTDVLFVNGNRPERIDDIPHGRYEGTLFAGATA